MDLKLNVICPSWRAWHDFVRHARCGLTAEGTRRRIEPTSEVLKTDSGHTIFVSSH
jgi:hypothetical protein